MRRDRARDHHDRPQGASRSGRHHRTGIRRDVISVETVADVERLGSPTDESKPGYVTQTTLSVGPYVGDRGAAQAFPIIQGPKKDDILHATQNPPGGGYAARDFVIVVVWESEQFKFKPGCAKWLAAKGCRLPQAGRNNARSEIDPWFAGKQRVGVTAVHRPRKCSWRGCVHRGACGLGLSTCVRDAGLRRMSPSFAGRDYGAEMPGSPSPFNCLGMRGFRYNAPRLCRCCSSRSVRTASSAISRSPVRFRSAAPEFRNRQGFPQEFFSEDHHTVPSGNLLFHGINGGSMQMLAVVCLS